MQKALEEEAILPTPEYNAHDLGATLIHLGFGVLLCKT